MMRGYLCVDKDKKDKYLEVFFNAYWVNNLDLSINENIFLLLNKLKIDNNKFLEDLQSQSIKDK